MYIFETNINIRSFVAVISSHANEFLSCTNKLLSITCYRAVQNIVSSSIDTAEVVNSYFIFNIQAFLFNEIEKGLTT